MNHRFVRRLTSSALHSRIFSSNPPFFRFNPSPTPNVILPKARVKSRLLTPIPLDELLAQHRRTRRGLLAPTSSRTSAQGPGDKHDLAYEEFPRLLRQARLYMGSRDSCDTQSLHLELIKRGFAGDLFFSNNLINLYAKAGDLSYARELFDQMQERNVVSWTCLITGHAQNGFPDEACRLFRLMIRSGLEPTRFTFGSVLRACQDSGPDRLFLGTQIHGLVSKTWHSTNTTVCNALISMYGGCRLDSTWDAQRVFDWTPAKHFITWNSIISVHSQRGDTISAFELFSGMQTGRLGCCLRPNEATYGSLITAIYSCSNGGCILEQVLANVLKSGFSKDLYVGSALVSAFSRFGLLNRAKEIFQQMDEKNAISMNGLMVGLFKQNLGEAAVEVFRETRGSVIINSDSYVVLLSAISEFSKSDEARKKGMEVHGHAIRTGLIASSIAIGNGLVNVYAKCGAVDDAVKVFDHLNVKDQVSWNTMISGFDQNGFSKESLSSFRLMLRNDIQPSNYAIISTLSSCANLRLLSAGVQVHCIGTKLGLDMDVSVSNSLLTMYGACGRMSDCQRLFSYMTKYDQVSWNSMIGALASNKVFLTESLRIFLDMTRRGWYPNKVTIINVFTAVSALSDIVMCRQVHNLVLKHGMSGDIVLENALLSSYAKSGEMDSCECLFRKLADRRNEVSWNSMISGYIQNGLMQKAMDFVWFMIHNGPKMDGFTFATVLSACASIAALDSGMEIHAFGIRSHLETDEPDLVTFVGVLSACSHAGLVEEGLKYFESMKNHGLVPQTEHYSCVIDILGRTGKLNEMEDFIKRMPVRPNNLIWRTVLVACRRSKDGAKSGIWKQASEMLLELEPENPVNYVLISSMYASRGRWEDVAKTRTAMRTLPVKKEAGRSWVTLHDGLHVFVAGDRSHPNTEEIYAELHVLIQKIRDAGYVPQAEFTLYDIDMETKEELLSYHSEKLAVAFVLTRSCRVPIRIMKNLRVCGDCHSAFCYISKIIGRKITLRDCNRFHHFENGLEVLSHILMMLLLSRKTYIG
ncbi:hypothetical protein C4D60_Mb09t17990 [Musa balbisiana]|uniref:DYW domain-containing protein n=1 Tax=Musa balbisiana TaxID=52838 RepID=A0A4S8IHA6_MUSBA|nr:hypothetical protein C4D60_Mb09t17990 [Musa balbisiana]